MAPRKVFVSYRRDDSPGMVGRIKDRLVQELGEDNVFIDVESMIPSKDFRFALREAVAECDILLAIIGPDWTAASGSHDEIDWVKTEIEFALHTSSVSVLPVLIGDAEMPPNDRLPVEIRDVGFLHAARIRNDPDFHEDVDRMLSREPFGIPIGTRVPRVSTGRGLGVGLAVAAVLVVGVAAWLLSSGPDEGDETNDATGTAIEPVVDSVTITTAATTVAESPDTSSAGASPSNLTVTVDRSSMSVSEDRTQRSNLDLEPDGVLDLGIAFAVTGRPSGLIVTGCSDEVTHSLTQWDTYTGNPPDDDAPFVGRAPHAFPTFQLAITGAGTTINPAVDLGEPLPDGDYRLYLPLSEPQAEGDFDFITDGLCITAVRSSGAMAEYETAFVSAVHLPTSVASG